MLACCIRIDIVLCNIITCVQVIWHMVSVLFFMRILVLNRGDEYGLDANQGFDFCHSLVMEVLSLMMCAAMISLILKIDASTQELNPVKEESNF